MSPLLAIEGLEVVYQRSIKALHGVNMSVPEARIVALLGANGAGKTTTLRAISGFIGLDNARVSAGTIRFMGEPIQGLRLPLSTRRGIVLVPERDKVFPNLTVEENLAVVISSQTAPDARRRLEDSVFQFFPRLAGLRRREAGLLSGGERQMLAVGAAIVCAPKLLLIDELSLGLAPVIVDDLLKRLIEIRAEFGMTILLVEQSAAVALRIADYAYVLENGRVALEGTAESLRSNERVQQLYLGTGGGERASYLDGAIRRRSERLHART